MHCIVNVKVANFLNGLVRQKRPKLLTWKYAKRSELAIRCGHLTMRIKIRGLCTCFGMRLKWEWVVFSLCFPDKPMSRHTKRIGVHHNSGKDPSKNKPFNVKSLVGFENCLTKAGRPIFETVKFLKYLCC